MTTSTYSSDHHVIIDAVTHALRSLPEDSRIALGFSGGLDSTVLLDALVRVAGPTRCVALHIHHGLSPNADDWLAHCEARAREYGVSFEARHVNIARERDIGVEAAAREARYRALNEMCEQQRVTTLWLAQHADDQAETVLLQLLRGAGMAGLAAMAAEPMNPQDASQSCLSRMRPLLTVARVQLEQYAHEHALRWVEDESNADTQYLRNALRHDIIPKLAAHFPAYRTALARTAKHAANAQQLLNELAELDMRSISRGVRLSRTALLALDDVRALNVMRF